MDPDTSKKVTDLLSLMEDISSDIDIKEELAKVYSEVESIRNEIDNLSKRFDEFEKTYQIKKQQMGRIKKDLEGLLPDKD